MRAVAELIWLTVLGACLVGVPGCAGKPRSTQMTGGDINEMTTEMGNRLLESSFLADRGPDSPPVTIAIDRVENLMQRTMLPTEDLWAIMNQFAASSDIMRVGRLKNIRFVIPADHLREGMMRGDFEAGYAANRSPTHQMAAVFRSIPRSIGGYRTDAYLCEFRILSLTDGSLEWSDQFQFKREAFGKIYD